MAEDPRQPNSSSTITRRKVLASSSVIALSSLAGCSGGGDGDGDGGDGGSDGGGSTDGGSGSVTIDLLTSGRFPAQKKADAKIAEDFKEETGNTVNMIDATGGNWTGRYSTMLQGGNPPEIAGPVSIAQIAGIYDQGQLAPLSETFSAINDEIGGTLPKHLLIEDKGDIWTVPFMTKPFMINYRTDYFANTETEISDVTDVEWDSYLQATSQVDQAGNPGTAQNFAGGPAGSINTWMWLWSNGANVFEERNGEIAVTFDKSPHKSRVVETLEYLQKMNQYNILGANAGWLDNRAGVVKEGAGSTYFTIGAVIEQYQIDDKPDMTSKVSGMHMPTNRERKNAGNHWVAPMSMAVSKNSANPDVGRDFIEFYSTHPKRFDVMNSVPHHLTPVTKAGFENEQYQSNPEIKNRPKLVEINKAVLDKSQPLIFTPSGAMNLAASQAYTSGTIGKLASRVMHGNASIEDSISATAKELRGML